MKQEFNFKRFIENLDSQISKARKIVNDIEHSFYSSDMESDDYEFNHIKLKDEIFELHRAGLYEKRRL